MSEIKYVSKYLDIDDELEVSEENMFIRKTLDDLSKQISDNYTYQKMFEELGCWDICNKNNIEKEYDLRFGNFDIFIKERLIGIYKRNPFGTMPPIYRWFAVFLPLSITINTVLALELLGKNYDFYKNRIDHYYNDNFKLTVPIYYDLTNNKFISHI